MKILEFLRGWNKKYTIIAVAVVLAIVTIYSIYEINAAKKAEQLRKDSAAVNVNLLPMAATVEIRNGSSKAGEATKMADLLEKNNFKIDKIGNANNTNYDITLIYVKPSINAKNILSHVRGSLIGDLPPGEEPTLSDILIIVGE